MRTPRAATTAMLAVVLLVACRSHKEATATTKEQYDIETAGSTIATTSRSQWLSRFSLDIDSFEIEWKLSAEDELARILPKRTLDCAEGEIVIPTHHFAEIGKMLSDTAMDLPEQFALGAVQPALRQFNIVFIRISVFDDYFRIPICR